MEINNLNLSVFKRNHNLVYCILGDSLIDCIDYFEDFCKIFHRCAQYTDRATANVKILCMYSVVCRTRFMHGAEGLFTCISRDG